MKPIEISKDRKEKIMSHLSKILRLSQRTAVAVLALNFLASSTAFARLRIGPDQQVDNTLAFDSYIQSLGSDNEGYAYMVWDERDRLIKARTYFHGSPHGEEIIVDEGGSDFFVYAPAICNTESGRLYLTWYKERRGVPELDIYFAFSSDHGASWSTPRQIKDPQMGRIYWIGGPPVIRCDNQGKIHVTWQAKTDRVPAINLYHNRSLDYGANWLPQEVQITNYTPMRDVLSAVTRLVLGRDGHVYSAWLEADRNTGENDHIYFKRSIDYGVTWPPDAVRIDHTLAPRRVSRGLSPVIAADQNGNVYIAWNVLMGPPYHHSVFFNRSHDDGMTWQTKDQRIDASPYGYGARLDGANSSFYADNSGHVYAAFVQFPQHPGQNPKAIFNASADSGMTWASTPEVIMDALGTESVGSFEIAASQNGKIFVTMIKMVRGFTRHYVYINASNNYGRNWKCKTRGCQVDSVDPALDNIRANWAQISSNESGNAVIIWKDDRVGVQHLYYNTADLT